MLKNDGGKYMEIAILSCVIVSIVLLITCVILVILLLKNKNNAVNEENIQKIFDEAQDNIIETLIEKNEDSRKSLVENTQTAFQAITSSLAPYMNTFDNKLNMLTQENKSSLEEMRKHVVESIEKMRDSNERSMKDIQTNNEQKLEEMRKTVDEKLAATVENRINSAFKVIENNLAELQVRFGEMSKLSEQVGNLNKVFNNVKTRGNWGEISLEALLEQILAPEQYERQFNVKENGSEKVDFVIKMPGSNKTDNIYLPIDSKFPTTDYEKLVDAIDRGAQDEAIAARNAILKRVKTEAKSISAKYINPPTTTDFAIIYLPSEGLYAEIVKDPGLCSELQNNYRVIVCGPTVIAALLNSLQVGFTTLKIQKNSQEIAQLMQSFRKEFDSFKAALSKVRKNAENVIESINDLDKKNGKIIEELSKVDSIDYTNNAPLQIIEGKEVGQDE